jgi:uncharacterized protein YcbX
MRSLEREMPRASSTNAASGPTSSSNWPDGTSPFRRTAGSAARYALAMLVLKGSIPCGRCGFITIAQDGIPLDVELLRTMVKRHNRNFGIYCDVLVPGEIKPG